MRGSRLRDELGLLLSAAMDTFAYAFRPDSAVSPICRFSTLIYAPELNVRFYIRGGTDDLYNVLPFREGDVHDAILDHLEVGDLFVDVGANIGYYSILGAKRVGPQGKVVAVEPMPDTVNQLRRNIAANGLTNVAVVPAAVHAESARTLPLRVAGGLFGMSSLEEDQHGDGRKSFEVPTITIDDLCVEYSRVKLMKLDIEGLEYEALKGAHATLLKTDYLVIECNRDRDAIVDILQRFGFSVTTLSFTLHILAHRSRQ